MRGIERSLLAIAATLFALYACQFVLRAIDQKPLHGRVNGQLYTWGRLVETNRFGFREREFDVPKPGNVYRVMVLGDSLTWGTGLAIGERYTEEAQLSLHPAMFDKRVEVLNFGRPGIDTTKERDLLRDLKDTVNPDLIVVGFALNDVQPRAQDYSIEQERLEASLVGRAIGKLAEICARLGLRDIGAMTQDLFYRTAKKLGVIPTWQVALQRCYEPASDEWRGFVQALSDIKSMSDDMDLQPPIFLVLNQGVYLDRPTDYSNPDEKLAVFIQWYEQAKAAAAASGFTACDNRDQIAAELGPAVLTINKHDGHPSARLNRIYGERLGREIVAALERQGRPME